MVDWWPYLLPNLIESHQALPNLTMSHTKSPHISPKVNMRVGLHVGQYYRGGTCFF